MASGAWASPPDCPYCDTPIKRDIILFGEDLKSDNVYRATWFMEDYCDVLLCVGSTLSVWPVADLPGIAKRHGAKVIVINGETTDFDHRSDIVVQDDIASVLRKITGTA